MPTEKQRREAERRRLRRRLERRAHRDARRRRFAVIASIVGTLVVAAIVVTVVVASGNDSPDKPAATKTGTTATCSWPVAGNPARSGIAKPPVHPPKTGRVNLIVESSQGPMTFQLNRAAAPCAVASFVSLAGQKYFDSSPCHRLTTSGIYVLQCGDPTGKGSGGPGYTFADELTGKERYVRGVLAMANSGPDTNGSQFFIVYKNSPTLSANYTLFGKVMSGLGVVDKVAAKGSDNANNQGDGHPKLPMTLTSVNVVQ